MQVVEGFLHTIEKVIEGRYYARRAHKCSVIVGLEVREAFEETLDPIEVLLTLLIIEILASL